MLWYRFHVGFHVLLWKTLLAASLLHDVTGKAVLEAVCCGFFDVTALARFWTSSDGWFQSESPAGRPPGQPCVRWRAQLRVQEHKRVTRDVQAMFKRVKRAKRERAHSRVVLNCPFLDIAHRRLVQSERRYGAEPRPCSGFLGWNLRDPTFHSFRGRYKLTDFICLFSHT